MKRILVVGANGFVGRQVLQTLEKGNYELYATSHHEDINPNGNYR
ncbi:MAG: NAD-dependent epimerase/dehydratase family protein, partial [Tannerellaceae bacterium]